MLKLVISLCLTTLFFGTAQADVVTTLNFTSPSTTSSTVTITAGGTVDFDLDVTFNPPPQTPVGDPIFFNLMGTQVSSCTGVADCQEQQLYAEPPLLLSLGNQYLEWQTVPGQFPGDGTGGVTLTGLGSFSFSLTYPNPGFYEIFTYGGYPGVEEEFPYVDCFTDFVNGVATGPAGCYGVQVGQGSQPIETAGLSVNVLPAAVPEPSYRIFLAALLGVLFVVWRRAQSTN